MFQQALALDDHDRATLAGPLLESLGHDFDPFDPNDVEFVWQEEMQRRVSDLDTNHVELMPWEAVKAKIRRIIDARGLASRASCRRCRA